MDVDTVWNLFTTPLFSDIEDKEQIREKKPLLAHYTSLDVLEKILKSDEVWFSNPLFMNDLDEVKFGIIHGSRFFKSNSVIRDALRTEPRHINFVSSLDHFIGSFEQNHLLDTYVFCLSEHEREDRDGLLSMWRGYGGNGRGAALVFDSAKITYNDESPLIIARCSMDRWRNAFPGLRRPLLSLRMF